MSNPITEPDDQAADDAVDATPRPPHCCDIDTAARKFAAIDFVCNATSKEAARLAFIAGVQYQLRTQRLASLRRTLTKPTEDAQ